MALETTLTGSKDEFVDHLRNVAAGHASAAKAMNGPAKARQDGLAEGLEKAAELVHQWVLPPTDAAGANGEHPSGGEPGNWST